MGMKTISLPGKLSFQKWRLVIDLRRFAAGAGPWRLSIGYWPFANGAGHRLFAGGVVAERSTFNSMSRRNNVKTDQLSTNNP